MITVTPDATVAPADAGDESGSLHVPDTDGISLVPNAGHVKADIGFAARPSLSLCNPMPSLCACAVDETPKQATASISGDEKRWNS
jgi:hypothetical protein